MGNPSDRGGMDSTGRMETVMEIRTNVIQQIQGRIYEGTSILEGNIDDEGLLVVILRDMKPGQRVAFRIEELGGD